MAKFLELSVELFTRKYLRKRNNRYALVERKSEAKECIFLKDKKCLVYKARPSQCQTFPWWKENLNTKESWESVARDCEGINDAAPMVPYSQIVQLLST
jgi:Fe-S-cluster containining protein